MADNFTAFIIHHQTAPESRNWLAKLMGTTALWQSTDQTAGHAATGAAAGVRAQAAPDDFQSGEERRRRNPLRNSRLRSLAARALDPHSASITEI